MLNDAAKSASFMIFLKTLLVKFVLTKKKRRKKEPWKWKEGLAKLFHYLIEKRKQDRKKKLRHQQKLFDN